MYRKQIKTLLIAIENLINVKWMIHPCKGCMCPCPQVLLVSQQLCDWLHWPDVPAAPVSQHSPVTQAVNQHPCTPSSPGTFNAPASFMSECAHQMFQPSQLVSVGLPLKPLTSVSICHRPQVLSVSQLVLCLTSPTYTCPSWSALACHSGCWPTSVYATISRYF